MANWQIVREWVLTISVIVVAIVIVIVWLDRRRQDGAPAGEGDIATPQNVVLINDLYIICQPRGGGPGQEGDQEGGQEAAPLTEAAAAGPPPILGTG